jgi:glycosyltransferase involved in cell wall biosynthesis
MPGQSICLNMIVKDESHVIRRCLDTVKPFISHWVIVDTGSTDGTQQIIREHLAGIPGELHERPWKDFGHNRTEALELAKGQADYTLVIDADEVLLTDPGFRLPSLDADGYEILHIVGDSGTAFYMLQLVRSSLPWRYVGVLHEVMTCDQPYRSVKLLGLRTKGYFDSARNADPAQKYARDAQVLEKALESEPDNARYVFYLGQSYRDAGQIERALDAYERRAAMGGFPEEIWYSLFQLGVLHERRGGDFAPALAAYLRAYQFRPTRAEPLCELARHYREKAEYALAFLFANAAIQIPRPADIHFLDERVYDWRALDEYAIAAYYVGKYRESVQAADQLLGSGKLPASERARVEENRRFGVERLNSEKQSHSRRVRNERKRKRQRKR